MERRIVPTSPCAGEIVASPELFNVFFRFAAGLLLVVLVSMVGVRLEKQTLEMRRAVSVQYYQTDVLLELLVRLRLETQKLTAPAQVALMQQAREEADPASIKSQAKGAKKSERKSVPARVQQGSQPESMARKSTTEPRKGSDEAAVTPPESRSRIAFDENGAFSPDDDDAVNPPLLRVLHPFNPRGLD